MTDHPDHEMLFCFFDDPDLLAADPTVDFSALRAHVEQCAECQFELEVFRELTASPNMADLLRFAADFPAESERHRSTALHEQFAAEAAFHARASADVDLFMPQLLALPVDRWEDLINQSPEHRTYVLAARILEEAENQLNSRPADALPLIEIADHIVANLDHGPTQLRITLLGDVWRLRASAFRHLFRLEDSLAATFNAETIYSQLRCDAFPIAQAWHTRAGTLFKMTRWSEALDLNAKAAAVLLDHGASLPFAKCLMLEAGIRLEQGDTYAAQRLWDQALLVLSALDDPRKRAAIEIARCHANIAECNYRLHNYEQAIAEALRAIVHYRALGMNTEAIRSSWTVALAQLQAGHAFALDNLETAASEFESLQMYGDAGFVRLDIVEALLQRGEHERAEPLALSLVQLFTKAGVTVASVQALEYLRESVSAGIADPPLINYIREYVATDDPARTFAPPGAH
jgi:tetratricopeptide (TPR) repeat protein